MGILGRFILIPIYIVMFLMDVTIFFLFIRLLTHVFQAKPLLLLDRIGSTGVEIVTGTISRYTRRWWKRPLSSRQEEALALLILSVTRLVLGVVVS